MYKIIKYSSQYFDLWNEFIEKSKNGTFLFHRNFMEYHKDRFEDFSLLVFKKETLVAILPANSEGDKVYSHQGLTYGGLILEKNIGFQKVEAIFNSVISFIRKNNISSFILKNIPLIYCQQPTFELETILFNLNARLYRKEQNLAIDYRIPLNIHKTKQKHYRKNQALGFKVEENSDFTLFWDEVLIPRLKKKHDAKPVHTILEINKLAKLFPENIKQFNIYLDGEIMAGITIFKTKNVVKSQYGAVTTKGEKYRALDYLFLHLINKFQMDGFTFFDMGIVAGNLSLLKQKEELGCYQYVQDFYQLNL